MLRGERNGSLWINRGRHSQKERHKVWTSGIILVLSRSFRIDTSHCHIHMYCQWKIRVRPERSDSADARLSLCKISDLGLFSRKLSWSTLMTVHFDSWRPSIYKHFRAISVVMTVWLSQKTEVDRYGKVLTYGKTDTGYKILMRLYQGRARSNVDILVYFQQRANPNQRRLFINLVYF